MRVGALTNKAAHEPPAVVRSAAKRVDVSCLHLFRLTTKSSSATTNEIAVFARILRRLRQRGGDMLDRATTSGRGRSL
ncbi:MAG: hypothetical protein C0483_20700 [Pirellula sp.]|nr:hypothetical protein [Pirellula sp.]